MAADTRTAFRRDLAFDSLADLEADLDRVRTAHHAGTLRVSGNWTPGQILGHLAKWMSWYLDDSFPFQVTGPLRFFGKLFKSAFVSAPFKPGIKFKPKSGDLGGDPEYSFENGWDKLQAQLDRIRAGESLACTTPLVGPVTHEEGMRIQLNHAALHMSFLHLDSRALSLENAR